VTRRNNDHIHSVKRRIDDRISELWEKVRTAKPNDKELPAMSRQLLCLWHEKMNFIRDLAAARLADLEVPNDGRAGGSGR
jgi:hypothetical protein